MRLRWANHPKFLLLMVNKIPGNKCTQGCPLLQFCHSPPIPSSHHLTQIQWLHGNQILNQTPFKIPIRSRALLSSPLSLSAEFPKLKQQNTRSLCFCFIKTQSVFLHFSKHSSLFAPFLQIYRSGSSPSLSWLLLPDPPSSRSNPPEELSRSLEVPPIDELQPFSIALRFLAELDPLSSELRLAFSADRGVRLLLPVRSFQLLFLRSFFMRLMLVFVFSLWMLMI